MNETEKYVQQYKDAFNLKKNSRLVGSSKDIILDSVFNLAKIRVVSFGSALFLYINHLWKYKRYFSNIFEQKDSGVGKDVLLIGNGPSQGLIDLKFLDSFSKNGNDTMAINFWHENKSLSKHIPSYMIFSDPYSFDEKRLKSKASGLIEYLSKNSINIVAPINQIKNIKDIKSLKTNKFHGFVDIEFKGWDNTHPAFPRGYTSMTMYKMLAWAVYKNYDNIYIIGMDNTYIRTMFNDHNNQLWNVENHAGSDPYLIALPHKSIATRLQELVYLFSDLRKFKHDNIYNIDLYSLIDQFEKKDLIGDYKNKI
jgi:hypothetical protein